MTEHSTVPPQQNIQRGAKVRTEMLTYTVGRDLHGDPITEAVRGRKFITFTYQRPDGVKEYIEDMADDAPTQSCHDGRHDDCNHRAGMRCEGGVQLKGGLDYFIWRCGCPCHRDPTQVGMLFTARTVAPVPVTRTRRPRSTTPVPEQLELA